MKLNYDIDRRLYPHNSSMYEVYFDQSVLISSSATIILMNTMSKKYESATKPNETRKVRNSTMYCVCFFYIIKKSEN